MADAKLAETTSRKFGVVGGMGWTRLGGYIKPDKTGANGTLPSRQFIIDGPGAALEVYARVWGMRLSVAHQTFIGFASAMQTSAYVAWPYNFLMIKAGMSIE